MQDEARLGLTEAVQERLDELGRLDAELASIRADVEQLSADAGMARCRRILEDVAAALFVLVLMFGALAALS
jgi:hypothetical protein